MKLQRVPYSEKDSVKTEQIQVINGKILNVPVFDFPINPRENFRRVIERDHPLWVPSVASDFNYCQAGELTGLADLRFDFSNERCVWTDMFGCEWLWEPNSGGSMLRPGGKKVLEDITEWPEKIVWPSLDEDRIRACCEAYMSKPWYHPERMNYFDFGQGCTERLVAVMGGYAEAMMAFAEEPEACRDFMMALSEHHVRMLDAICKYYPVDMILYHDDWGTERDTFFSPAMMEDLVYEPTKLFFDHVREKGIVNNFHTCGKIERFIDYIDELNPDFLQLQARANNLDRLKAEYGDRLGFDAVIRGMDEQETAMNMHAAFDQLGAGGGMVSTVFALGEDALWGGIQELYCYSRERYAES